MLLHCFGFCSYSNSQQTTWCVLSNGVLFRQDNERPHTSHKTRGKLETSGWEVLPHPSYSPHLPLLDFHLFGPSKENLGSRCFPEDELKECVLRCFRHQDKSFYSAGINALVRRWEK